MYLYTYIKYRCDHRNLPFAFCWVAAILYDTVISFGGVYLFVFYWTKYLKMKQRFIITVPCWW